MSKTNYRHPLGNRPLWTANQLHPEDVDEDDYYSEWVPIKTAYTRLPTAWIADRWAEDWLSQVASGWHKDAEVQDEEMTTPHRPATLSELIAMWYGILTSRLREAFAFGSQLTPKSVQRETRSFEPPKRSFQ